METTLATIMDSLIYMVAFSSFHANKKDVEGKHYQSKTQIFFIFPQHLTNWERPNFNIFQLLGSEIQFAKN